MFLYTAKYFSCNKTSRMRCFYRIQLVNNTNKITTEMLVRNVFADKRFQFFVRTCDSVQSNPKTLVSFALDQQKQTKLATAATDTNSNTTGIAWLVKVKPLAVSNSTYSHFNSTSASSDDTFLNKFGNWNQINLLQSTLMELSLSLVHKCYVAPEHPVLFCRFLQKSW